MDNNVEFSRKILVVGSLNMDLVVEVPHLPIAGETILGNLMRTIPGGKGANQAFAAAKLGGEVAMLGCVGEDGFGETLLKNLSAANVDTSCVRRSKEIGTGTAMIWVDESGNNSIVVSPSANDLCNDTYLHKNKRLLEQCNYVIMQMEIPLKAIYYIIETGRFLNKTIILNPAPMPSDISLEHLRKVDYITPNETELEKLLNMMYTENIWKIDSIDSIAFGSQRLAADLGCKILVTAGEQGAVLATARGCDHYPSAVVSAVDTTAAGDCFTAAFVVALSEGKSEPDAVRFANAAASITVTRRGAQTSLPSREEVM